MQKIIIAITGEMASGKDTLAKYLVEKYHAKAFHFSDSMRDVLDRLHLEETRDNLAKLSHALRQTFGEDIFAAVIETEVMREKEGIVIIDGVRRSSDIEFARKQENFILIYVEADIEKRYDRIKNREQNADDTEKTFQEFLHDHTLETEVTIPLLRTEADHIINNDGTLEDFYKQADAIVSTILPNNAQ